MRKKMIHQFSVRNFIQLGVLGTFVIGSFFDSRLNVNSINISYILAIFYLFGLGVTILSTQFDKKLVYRISFFYLIVLIQTLINWSIWGINDYDNYSISKLIIFSGLTIPMCIYVSTLDTMEKLTNFVQQLSFVGGFLFILTILQFVLTGTTLGEERISVLGGGPIVYSRWLGVFLLAIFYNNIKSEALKPVILIVGFFLMLYSGSRGPVIFILLIIFLLRTVKIQYFLLFLALMMLLILTKYNLLLSIIDNTPVLGRLFGFSYGSSLIDGSSTTMRLFLYYDSFELIKANLFGYGIGNFSIYSNTSQFIGLTSYPHNFLLEIFLEHGLLVFIYVICCVIFIFKVFLSWFIQKKLNNENKLFFAVWLFCFLNSLVSGDLSDSRLLILFTCIFFKYNQLYMLKKG